MSRAQTWLTPARILTLSALALLLMIIFVPNGPAGDGASFSSYSSGPAGTRALYETLRRLGFAMQRRTTSLASNVDSSRTYVILAPAQPLTATEITELLAAVRGGATVVFTPRGGALTDSLGFTVASAFGRFHSLAELHVAGGNPDSVNAGPQLVLPITASLQAKHGAVPLLWIGPVTGDRAEDSDSARRPALVLAQRVGRGWAVAIAPAELLTNQILAGGLPAIAVVRALELTDAGTRARPVVFDEYHHGYGTHSDVVSTVGEALTGTPAGRMVLQVIAAGLVLLLVFAVRPIAPRAAPAITRRSPLEHVAALASAYTQVDARRLAADRLVRGIRRRHPLGTARSVPHDVYLAALRRRVPSAGAEVDRIAAALLPDSSEPAASIGTAAANIERALSSD